jgi:hypothetical protein
MNQNTTHTGCITCPGVEAAMAHFPLVSRVASEAAYGAGADVAPCPLLLYSML